METYKDILNERRKRLGMTYRIIAERTGLGWATVQRALTSGKNTTLESFTAIANVLGCKLIIKPIRRESELIKYQAEARAEILSGLVQGTSALEAQAVSQKKVNEVKQQLVHNLMSGCRRRLWT